MATQQCTATLTFNDGTEEDVTNSASWESSATSVATVSNTGLVTSVGEGTATITATHSGLSGTANVEVTVPEPEAENLSVTPANISLEHEEV